MATIERRPLPPPNSTATKITEADRAEIIARANDVIDYYLNGLGSYFESGTRRPLVGEYGDSTVEYPKNFKDNVIASMQFADDPNSIMRSVADLIDRTIGQVKEAVQNDEGRDHISLPPPDTVDPFDDPRVTSPPALNNAALPISLPVQAGQISGSKPLRILSRRIVDTSQGSNHGVGAPAPADRQDLGNWTSSLSGTAPPASDRPESLDNRFGNWGTAPAGRFGDTRSPVLRALEKYRRSAAPDGSAPASVQGASWGMRSSPPNRIGTGGVLGNYMDPSLNDHVQGALPTGPSLSGPIAPDLSTDETEIASDKPVRYLGSRIAGQPRAPISSAGAQPLPSSPQPSEPLVGIFSGQPMFPFPPPPSFWSRRDDARARSDDEEERSLRWLRLLSPP